MNNIENNSFAYSEEDEEIRLSSLIKKMISHTKLMVGVVALFVIISFVYAFVLYEPAYDVSASYIYELKENSTFSNLYGVKYKTISQLVQKMKHYDTIDGFIETQGLDPDKYRSDKFLENVSISANGTTINVYISKQSQENVDIYKAYFDYAINLLNNDLRSETLPLLKNAESVIEGDIKELSSLSFNTEETRNTNYQKMISLKEYIKAIDIQLEQLNSDAIKLSSEYMQTKVSSRGKPMIIIVLVGIIIGAAIDFFVSFFDNHIYFSTDIKDVPYLDNHLLSCIPLYKNNQVSEKEFDYILSKLKGKNHILVSSISSEDNSSFAESIEKAAKRNGIELDASSLPSLGKDPNILSSIESTDAAIIILKAGENTVDEAKNFARDCSLIGRDNYFFIINGLNVSDPMVTKFESDSRYIHFNIFKFRTYREHYKKYLG